MLAGLTTLLASLPTILLSAVIVAAPGAAFGPWPAVILVAIWLVSGVVVALPLDESAVARLGLEGRRPDLSEEAKLADAWTEVTEAAGVDGSAYSLWVQDSSQLNAYAAPGRVVGITGWALVRLTHRQVAAVLAHELGHHLSGRQGPRMLAAWYSLPRELCGRLLAWMVYVTVMRVIDWLADQLRDSAPGFARRLHDLTELIIMIAFFAAVIAALTLVVGLSATIGLGVLIAVEPFAEAALSRRGESEADAVAVDLGYGPELCEVLREWLIEEDDSDVRSDDLLSWLASHPPAPARMAAIEARMGGSRELAE